MSVVYVGAYAYSFGDNEISSSSCGSTTASGMNISVSNAPSSNSSAATTMINSYSGGTNSYGGSMSVVYVGAYAYSSLGGSTDAVSESYCDSTLAIGLFLLISNSTFAESLAISRKLICVF